MGEFSKVLYEMKTVYGPVPSWRLGRSLGIDLISGKKACSFDCIYCQLGRTANKIFDRRKFVETERVEEDIREFLGRTEIDVITFIPLNGKLITSEDNLAITISYKNGSVAHLSYVCIGNKGLNKERIEIFCGKRSIVIDNFEKLDLYGTREKNIKLKEIDKGWLRELEEFAKLIKGEESLILSLEMAFLATKETMQIRDIINGKNS